MLIDQIKARMFQAITAGATVEKEILRVAMGEITTEAARPGRQGTDEETQAILPKFVKSNEETLASTNEADNRADLHQNAEILGGFLPASLKPEEIMAAHAPVV